MPEQLKKPLVSVIYFALAASTLLAFWQVRNFNFVGFDDNLYVYENPHVLNGLTWDGVIWAFTTGHATNWHPLTWLSLMLDCQLFGPRPGWMHLVNLLIHIANTLLLFTVLKKMTGSLWPSAFVSTAFALHPMHVESAVWIAERKDVLSTFFFLLTLAIYAGYVRRPSVFRYITSLTIFTLGLMAKPMLVTLPFVLLLLDYWPLDRLTPQIVTSIPSHRKHKSALAANKHLTLYRLIIEKIPFFALAAVSSVITFLVQWAGGAIRDINKVSLYARIANVFLSYAKYMGKMFWPHHLAMFYPFGKDGSIQFWQVVLCALLLLVISFFVIRLGYKHKYLPVGWFWFVGTLVPVIGFVQVGRQAYADRYTYIPYIGLFIVIAWGLPQLLSGWPYRKVVLGISMVIMLTALGICANRQISFWNNGVTLFSHAIEVTQNNYYAYNNLGATYVNLGRYQDAIKAYKETLRIKPDYVEVYDNLGSAYVSLGRYQEAIEAYKEALRIKPDLAEAHNNLGTAYVCLGRYQDAIEAYKEALRIKPDLVEAHNNLGNAYVSLGHYQEAIEVCKQAIRIKPDYAQAHNNLGNAYVNLGRYQDAIEAYKEALKIKPDYAKAYYNLANAYVSLGRYQDAIEACKEALRIKPDLAEAHLVLGLSYLSIGDKGSALEEYKILKTFDVEMANKLFNLIYK